MLFMIVDMRVVVVVMVMVVLDLKFCTRGTALRLYILAKPWKDAECEPLVSVCAVVKWRRRRRAVGVHAMPFSSSTEAIYTRQSCVLQSPVTLSPCRWLLASPAWYVMRSKE